MSWTDSYDGPPDEAYFTKLHNEDPEASATRDEQRRREPVTLVTDVTVSRA